MVEGEIMKERVLAGIKLRKGMVIQLNMKTKMGLLYPKQGDR